MRSHTVAGVTLLLTVLALAPVETPARGRWSVEASEATSKQSDSLVVTLGVSANGTVSLLGQEVATGRALSRRASPRPRAFVAVLSTATGDTIEAVDFDDPTVLLCRGVPDGSGDADTAEPGRLESGVVRVTFAFDARARRVNVLARNEPVAAKAAGSSSGVVTIRTVAVLELGVLASSRKALPPYTTETLLMNGDPANRLDLVFLGDGYRAADLGKFRSDVLATVGVMATTPPYDRFMPLINVYLVNVVSNESGIDDPAAGIFRDTALDLTFKSDGVRQSCVFTPSPLKVFDAADLVPQYDEILVIANDSQRGGCAGAYFGCYTASPNFPNLGIHEFGHSFAFLADEYGGTVSSPPQEPYQANATIATSLQGLADAGKWDYWVTPGTPLPTHEGTAGVGLFEGALVSDRGVYRPAYTCAMRFDLNPFCPVCTEQIVLRLHDTTDPIDAFSTNPEPVSNDSRVLAVISDPAGDAPSPVADIRSFEVVQTGRDLAFELRVGAAIESPSSDLGGIFLVVDTPGANQIFLVDTYTQRLTRYDVHHNVGLPVAIGVVDFSGPAVSARIPLDLLGNPSTIRVHVETFLPTVGGAADTIDTGSVSISPLEEVFIDRMDAVTLQGRALVVPGVSVDPEWFIDGVEAGSEPMLSLSGQSLGSGVHSVEFRVDVTTPYVRRDPELLMTSKRTITIAVCGTGPVVRSVSIRLAGDGKLTIRGRRFEPGSIVQINGVAVSGAKRVKASGTVLTAKGPLANGLPLSSIALQGAAATVLVIGPDGGCTVYAAHF